MATTVADQMVETLVAAGVQRIYGIVGDSLNGFTDSLRRQGKIGWLHVRHEEVAAFAAGADAHLTGELAVCAGSCGPGQPAPDQRPVRLPPHRACRCSPSPRTSRRPRSGAGYFQETHPEHLFRECSSLLRAGLQRRTDAARARDGDPPRARPARRGGRGDSRRRGAAHGSRRAARRSPTDCARRARWWCRRRSRSPRLAELLNSAGKRHAALRLGLRRRARPGAGARRRAEGADRARAARQGACRVGQPIRRRHDRADRLLVRLSRDAGLRHAADAGHRLSRTGSSIRTTRGSRRSTSAARTSGGARRSTSASSATSAPTLDALLPQPDGEDRPHASRRGASRTTARRARGWTNWRPDGRAARCIRSISRAC